jgi:pectate lyase
MCHSSHALRVRPRPPHGRWAGALLTLALALAAGPAAAQTTLFSDNFEDGNADGWTIFQGSWSVVADGATRVYRQSATSSKYRSAAGSTAWTDYAVQARVKPTQWNGSDRFAGVAARFRDGRNTYVLALRSSNRVELVRVLNGANTTLNARAFTVALNTSYTLRLEVSGSALRGFVNGTLQVSASDGSFPSGRIGAATDYGAANFDDFTVTTAGAPTNQAPQVNAGPDQTITLPATARLAGQVSDDGLPSPPGAVTCTWSRSSGPGTVAFSPNANTLNAAASFSAAGSYQLTLACSDSQLSSSDSVSVQVNAPGANQPPQVNAGPDQTVNQPGAAFLNGTVVDDGQPNPPGAVTCSWSRRSGPGTVTFSPSAGALSVSATFSALGTYVLALTCSDSQLSGSDPVTVTVREQPTGDPGLIGFATVNALGQNGTTGGAGGPTVVVNDAAEFLEAIARPGPLVIRVQGMISLPGPMHDVTSDKSILGEGASSGITGGGLNIGLPLDDDIVSPPANAVHNVVVRNMTITNCPDDCINVQMFTHHVWLDHNDVSDQSDGGIDIKRGSDFITVSWNRFHNSDKNMLLGHDDSNGAQDIGRLRVSYHHNFFDGSAQRNPRIRFGEPVHVFNNYYLNITGYGVASQMNAGVMVENNYFDNVEKPTRNDVGGDPGRIVARGNINVNTEDPIVVSGSVAEPRNFYPYTLDPAESIPNLVRGGAGVGRITP